MTLLALSFATVKSISFIDDDVDYDPSGVSLVFVERNGWKVPKKGEPWTHKSYSYP